jgi:hypothetical protein
MAWGIKLYIGHDDQLISCSLNIYLLALQFSALHSCLAGAFHDSEWRVSIMMHTALLHAQFADSSCDKLR